MRGRCDADERCSKPNELLLHGEAADVTQCPFFKHPDVDSGLSSSPFAIADLISLSLQRI